MSDKSKIEWTDATWNPVTGCTKVSSGCKHCYAERQWPRMTKLVPAYAGREFTDVRCHPERLDQPLHWKKPRRIFVNSMSDLFHESIPDDFILSVFVTMAAARQHTFQVLTKRPGRMRDLLTRWKISGLVLREGCGVMLRNVWLGVSVENQEAADERIPLLLSTPAAVRWVSAEPLLGHVSFRWASWVDRPRMHRESGHEHHLDGMRGIDWLVVGGESGQNARPMHPDWARSLRDECADACVPYLFKQWGEWSPDDAGETRHADTVGVLPSGKCAFYSQGYVAPWDEPERLVAAGGVRLDGRTLMDRIGKKRAGRLLDGVQHDAYPGGTA